MDINANQFENFVARCKWQVKIDSVWRYCVAYDNGAVLVVTGKLANGQPATKYYEWTRPEWSWREV
jgi:hypothetical protein